MNTNNSGKIAKEKITERRLHAAVYDVVTTVTTSLVIIALLFAFLFRIVDVNGTSMLPNLQDKERVLLSRLPYQPAYGDIVVVSRGDEMTPLIKRIIGLPGDTIRIDAADGTVYRNEIALKEPYISVPTAAETMTQPVTVADGEVFIMGDNRVPGGSWDSRSFGCVGKNLLVGKVVFRLLPLSRMGVLRP